MSRKERTRRTRTARLDQAAVLGALPVPPPPIIHQPAMSYESAARELGDSLYENRRPRTWRTLGDLSREQKLEAILDEHDARGNRQTTGSDFNDGRPADSPQIAVLRREVAKNIDRRHWEQWAEEELARATTPGQRQQIREALRKHLEENQ